MEYTITPKGLIKDIYAQRNFAYQLLGKGKAYENIIGVLLTYDDNVNYPSLSQLTEQLNISYAKFKRLVTELYEDLCNVYENGIDYSIEENEYIFYMEWQERFAYVKLQNLPVCPRVGETVHMPFFKEKVGVEYFHVKSVDHYFSDSFQSVYFHLAAGQYNVFWNHFRDEQYAKGKMTSDEYGETNEIEIRKKYGFRWI